MRSPITPSTHSGDATGKPAHQAAVAKTAASTGVSGVAGNTTTGHLVAIGSWQENAMVSLMAIRHTNNSNVWIGLCDSDDADLGGAGWADAAAEHRPAISGSGRATRPAAPARAQRLGQNERGRKLPGVLHRRAQRRGRRLPSKSGRMDAGTTSPTMPPAPCAALCIEWEIGSATPIAGAR